MAYHDFSNTYPSPDLPRSTSYESTSGGISSRITSVSDFNSPETPLTRYDDAPQTTEIELRAAHSNGAHYDGADIVDARMPSSANMPQRPITATGGITVSSGTRLMTESAVNQSRTWSPSLRCDYEPLSPARSFSSGRGAVGRSWQTSRNPAIPEGDEVEMGEYYNFRRMPSQGTGYARLSGATRQDEETGNIHVDLSTFTGPQDEATAREYRRLESSGQLTGGLGAGLKPELRMNQTELLRPASSSTSPVTPIALTRGLSIRTGLNRRPTLRDLGQREANKQGKIIEVVLDSVPDSPGTPGTFDSSAAVTDLSSVSGGSARRGAQGRVGTFPAPNVVTYYPQPNWKPFSMRWPYLVFLIAVSIGLAVGQECLYQKSSNPKGTEKPGLFVFKTPDDINTWDYFSFKYFPTIIAVIFGILWQLADFEVKRLEPYYRLSKEGGALAAESINVDYVTVFNLLRPLKAIRCKHYTVAVSSVATLLAVSLVPTLQSASLVLYRDGDRISDLKYIVVSMVWSRILSVVLLVISAFGFVLLYQLQTRRSGLVGDVKGIAGIAAMASKSHVLMDFKGLDTVPPQDIHNKLKGRRYTLRNSSLAPVDANSFTREEKDEYDQYRLSANPHPFMMRLVAGVPLIASMILFLAFIPSILFIQQASVVQFTLPWLFTAIAVLIKIAFQTLEQAVRMMEPFYRLACRHASPRVLILDYTGMAFGYMPIRALINKDYLVFWVGLGSVFAEILTVSVTSFVGVNGYSFLPGHSLNSSGTGEETMTSFWVSLVLSVVMLTYLILVAAIVYKFRRRPFLPRQPGTIASILAFIHQSNMLYDFVLVDVPDSEKRLQLSSTNLPNTVSSPSTSIPILQKGMTFRSISTAKDQSMRVRQLEKKGKKYGLGWFRGRDGEVHCGIDQEELQRPYIHHPTQDTRKMTNPWDGWWSV